jgi:hypothetical protein
MGQPAGADEASIPGIGAARLIFGRTEVTLGIGFVQQLGTPVVPASEIAYPVEDGLPVGVHGQTAPDLVILWKSAQIDEPGSEGDGEDN